MCGARHATTSERPEARACNVCVSNTAATKYFESTSSTTKVQFVSKYKDVEGLGGREEVEALAELAVAAEALAVRPREQPAAAERTDEEGGRTGGDGGHEAGSETLHLGGGVPKGGGVREDAVERVDVCKRVAPASRGWEN